MAWYEVHGFKGHQGAGREEEATIYVEGVSPVDALSLYNRMPGVKKHGKMPTVIDAPLEMQPRLEAIMETSELIRIRRYIDKEDVDAFKAPVKK